MKRVIRCNQSRNQEAITWRKTGKKRTVAVLTARTEKTVTQPGPAERIVTISVSIQSAPTWEMVRGDGEGRW